MMDMITFAMIWGLFNWGIGVLLNSSIMEVFGIGIFFGALCVVIHIDKASGDKK